jgi:hypothetical protein
LDVVVELPVPVAVPVPLTAPVPVPLAVPVPVPLAVVVPVLVPGAVPVARPVPVPVPVPLAVAVPVPVPEAVLVRELVLVPLMAAVPVWVSDPVPLPVTVTVITRVIRAVSVVVTMLLQTGGVVAVVVMVFVQYAVKLAVWYTVAVTVWVMMLTSVLVTWPVLVCVPRLVQVSVAPGGRLVKVQMDVPVPVPVLEAIGAQVNGPVLTVVQVIIDGSVHGARPVDVEEPVSVAARAGAVIATMEKSESARSFMASPGRDFGSIVRTSAILPSPNRIRNLADNRDWMKPLARQLGGRANDGHRGGLPSRSDIVARNLDRVYKSVTGDSLAFTQAKETRHDRIERRPEFPR